MNANELSAEALLPWIEVRFSRSPGPGGQNVNKVNTQVTLLFDYLSCPSLTDVQKSRIGRRLASRLSRDGELRVVSRRERTQAKNRRAALERLVELLRDALRTRTPRRKTTPTAASRQRRLASKRQRSELKRQRRSGRNESEW